MTLKDAKFFDVAHLAQSFREVAVDVIPGETTEFLSRWYQSAKGDADLTIWWDSEKRVVKQQLCLYGQVVEWNPIHGTRTGLVVEHEILAASELKGSVDDDNAAEIIHYDTRIQHGSIEQAVALLRAVEAIPMPDRALLCYNFRESPRLHKNARERALKAWAPKGEDVGAGFWGPGFWTSVRRRIFGK